MPELATHRISLTHNFETAHRLHHPGAPTKCQSIHGHSWQVTATLTAQQLDQRGMVLEFGVFKKAWRSWLDDHLDHHLVVHHNDPVAPAILTVLPHARLLQLEVEPTTENLAQWLFHHTAQILAHLGPQAHGVSLQSIHLQETRVNAAHYSVTPSP